MPIAIGDGLLLKFQKNKEEDRFIPLILIKTQTVQ